MVRHAKSTYVRYIYKRLTTVADRQGNGPNEDALLNVREDRLEANRFVVIAAVFVSLVVCAVFVGVAGGEIETHAFGLLMG